MNKQIKPSAYRGRLTARGSKSYIQRALALTAFTKGVSVLKGVSYSNDALTALEIIRQLGAEISKSEETLYIKGGELICPPSINCNESGLSVRMFTPLMALFDSPVFIEGTGSLLKRPQQVIVDTLSRFGAKVESENGFLPLLVKGPLKPGNIIVDGSFTSQVITGLLMALPFLHGDSTILVEKLNSKPYIDITLEVLQDFGIRIERKGYEAFYIQGGQSSIAREYSIEPDWSGMAFHLVGGAIAGKVEMLMEKTSSKQADRAIIEVLIEAGADVSISPGKICVSKGDLKAFEYDATDSPDLFPPLVVLAMNAKGISKIYGVERLLHKESSRARVLMQQFNSIGASIGIKENTMYVRKSHLKGGRLRAHSDHRIAMAGAIAALKANQSITIEEAESVKKSYPEFFEDFNHLATSYG